MKHRKIKTQKIVSSDYGDIGFIKENNGLSFIAKDFGERFLKDFPTEKDPHFFVHTYSTITNSFFGYIDLYIHLYGYLDISPTDLRYLEQLYWELVNPNANRTREDFKSNINSLLSFLHNTDKKISNKLNLLSHIECVRLYEGIRCLESECNFSTVVMSVSAVEHRLHKLIEKKNKKIYKAHFERETLGGIISLFKKDQYTDKKYQPLKKILPDKHRPLMEMLNIYRIFSAHPKDVVVTNQTAKLILSLSFLFLVDKDLLV